MGAQTPPDDGRGHRDTDDVVRRTELRSDGDDGSDVDEAARRSSGFDLDESDPDPDHADIDDA